jgi:hypothetical protein
MIFLNLYFPSSKAACKYTKGPWTECDPKTNARSRTLNLKKGDASCVQTRTIQKKCKKGQSENGKNSSVFRFQSLKWLSFALMHEGFLIIAVQHHNEAHNDKKIILNLHDFYFGCMSFKL